MFFHMIELTLQNRMNEVKKLYESLSLIGSLSLAISLPWIIYKALHLQKSLNNLFGKVVVITGASSGLGEALAHEFYMKGCQVVLCARRRQELDRVRTDLMHSHSTVQTHPPIIIPLDLADLDNLVENLKKIIAVTGKVDILINNGGVSHRGNALSTNIDVDRKIMMVNYFGTVALTKAILPDMVKRNEGHIVFISSVQGLIALPERSAYSASKHAMQAFGDSLRAEVADNNISVSVISPGYIQTNLSMNALTGSGANYGQMDDNTKSGYTPEYVAKKIVKAVAQKKKEMIISSMLPKIAIFLRKYLPSLYFFVMARRAKKSSLQKQ